ncbi:MAG TPA: AmmeMemoRadiSam system protein A [Acidobacteriota bacterium]|jgi:AmmeMemoRadiSam system protein A
MSELGPGEQSELLALARRTLELFYDGRRSTEYRPLRLPLAAPSAVFVSLYYRDRLRGCVGMLDATRPLYRNVIESTLSAAFRDPRFPPLDLPELARLSFEISVLSGFADFRHPLEIRVGSDGVQITRGPNRALLLPQVALRFGWDATRLLEETCAKAGLPRDAWARGARLEKFNAQVFRD